MNRRRFPSRRVPAAALCALLWMLPGCSGDQGRLAGSGSVTTNGFTGTVTRDGRPAAGIMVMLYESEYDPERDGEVPDSMKQVTDRAGNYRFDDLEAGGYNLIATHPSEPTVAFIPGLSIGASDSLESLAAAPLVPTGSVRIALPDTARASSAYYVLPGTGISALRDSAAIKKGEVVLERVPPSTYEFLYLRTSPSGESVNILSRPLAVSPEGAILVNPFARWKRSYKVTINTTPSGADVSEDLTGFPLLVRLHAGNFDFSSARPDGSDLRATKADGATMLPFELESWDPAAKSAAVWIRMDSILGDNTAQSIRIFSGNDSAEALPSTHAVFDTSDGFKGVWHLDETPPPVPGRNAVFLDRTANGFHGIPSPGLTPDASVPGVIGKALWLDGKDDFLELPASNLLLSGSDPSITVSAWFRPAALLALEDSIVHRLVSIRTDTAGISALALGVGKTRKISHYGRAADSVYQWSSTVNVDSLYHVALTFDQGVFKGYVDGRLDFSVAGPALAPGGLHPAILGAHMLGNRHFQGHVDEFRIERKGRGPGWIRMSYESQKPASASVMVE